MTALRRTIYKSFFAIPALSLMIILLSQSSIIASVFPIALYPLQNPPSLKWKKIDTTHFRVIYPEQIENDAIYVADYMEYVYPHVHKTSGAPEKRTPILLFTEYSISNGYASLAPRQSVWFNTPSQDFYGVSSGWYNMLGLHEYRHMLQFDSLNRGTLGALKAIFGDEVFSIAMGLSVPMWFFEGDAVAIETALSDSGRGRSPAFDSELRAQLLSGIQFNYYKALMGSYVDHDPLRSPYLMGYFLNTKIRKDYGASSVNRINAYTASIPVPYRYTFGVKNETGMHTSDLYFKTMNELKELWEKQIDGLVFSDVRHIQKSDNRRWRSAKNCSYLGDSIIALRNGIYDESGIVAINPVNGSERFIIDANPVDDNISSGGEKIAWSENISDPRWLMRSWSDIYVYDKAKDEKNRITYRQKLFAPSLSPDGSSIAAVEYSNGNKCSLVFINAETGKEISRVPNPQNEFIANPSWSRDGKSVVYESLHNTKGNSIRLYSLINRESSVIIPYSHDGLKKPVTNGTYIFYSSSYSGIDAIYAVDLKTKKIFQVVSRKFGAYMPAISADSKSLVFSDVTDGGYIASEVLLDSKKWIPIEKVNPRKVVYCEPLIAQESGKSIIKENIPSSGKLISDYWGLERILSVHSWYPFYNSLSKDTGVSFVAANQLSTFAAYIGYIYNFNEMTSLGTAGASYAGFYPIFDIEGAYGKRTSRYEVKINEKTKEVYDAWSEKTAKGTIRLPLDYSRGYFYRELELSASLKYTQKGSIDYIPNSEIHSNNNGIIIPASYTISFYNLKYVSGYVYPKWGQMFSVKYYHTPFKEGDYKGNFFNADAFLYFPGFFSRNNLYFEGAFEKQDVDRTKYRYQSEFLFSRGYDAVFHDNLVKGSANYTFPLFYPDKNILWLFYLKRIYFNAFGDYGLGIDSRKKYFYRSSGGELMFETYLLNISGIMALHIGLRNAYAFDARKDERNTYAVVFAISSGQ